MHSPDPKIIPFSNPFTIHSKQVAGNPHFLSATQQVVDSLICDRGLSIGQIDPLLPLFNHSEISNQSDFLFVNYLCPAAYTHLTRRYVIDTLSKWLVPGKQLEILGGLNLHFQFEQHPNHYYFVSQEIISIPHSLERSKIENNLSGLIADLKQKIPCEFLRQAQATTHPIFMPTNEEELMRNLIVLANQIQYVGDLPQVSIRYEKQTDHDLTFTVIIAQLLKKKKGSLQDCLHSSQIRMDVDEIRIAGYLKQKYAKEVAIVRITLDKKAFFRADFSVDLILARQKIVRELTFCLGPFRDFNGGMILKQDESFRFLRQEFATLSKEKELLLQNYFYSIKPGIMQTVHDASLLKKHFDMLQNAQGFEDLSIGSYYLCFFTSLSPVAKEALLGRVGSLAIGSKDLTRVILDTAVGFILQTESLETVQRFKQALLSFSF